jgi:hypothetical protein
MTAAPDRAASDSACRHSRSCRRTSPEATMLNVRGRGVGVGALAGVSSLGDAVGAAADPPSPEQAAASNRTADTATPNNERSFTGTVCCTRRAVQVRGSHPRFADVRQNGGGSGPGLATASGLAPQSRTRGVCVTYWWPVGADQVRTPSSSRRQLQPPSVLAR